tara:strand:- start:202 stop:858 length:657 start_codon:yes stop_codon:yes gene_type:complete
MAKLKHLQNLIRRIAQVDEGRARVLVMKARAAGHFTTGGRGTSAPDMVSNDAASALLLALQMEQPTDAGAAVKALRDLPIYLFGYEPGDRVMRKFEPDWNGIEGEGLGPHMPACFGGKVPATLGEALNILFAFEKPFGNRFDKIEHSIQWGGSKVKLSLADESHKYHGFDEDGTRAWEFLYETNTDESKDELGAWTVKTVHCEALRALHDLIHGGNDQ